MGYLEKEPLFKDANHQSGAAVRKNWSNPDGTLSTKYFKHVCM